MSASNWAVCPRCLNRARLAQVVEERKLADAYGKVPVEEFDAMRSALKPVDEEHFQSFREDYEFWVVPESGTWHASYGGECQVCGLSHEFKMVETIKDWSDDVAPDRNRVAARWRGC